MDQLRSKVIRLAHQNLNLRPHLLPLLKAASLTFEYMKTLEFPIGSVVEKEKAYWEGSIAASFVKVLQTVKALGFKQVSNTKTPGGGSVVVYDMEEGGSITFTKRPDAMYRYRIDLKL